MHIETPIQQPVSIRNLLLMALIVLGFVLGLGWGAYWFFALCIDKLGSIQGDLSKALIAASATLLVAVVTLVCGKLLEQHLKLREEIRAKKIPIYERHLAAFFKVLFGKKLTGKDPDPNETAAAFASFTEHAILWGSIDVIRAWIQFRNVNKHGADANDQLDALEGLFIAIRKDVGSEVKGLNKRELFKLFLNAEDDSSPPPPTATPRY